MPEVGSWAQQQRRRQRAAGRSADPGRSRAASGPQSRSSAADAAGPTGFQVGQTVEVTIEDVAQGGWCVARPADLPVMFVRHALPGERVVARVTEVTSRFARADATEIVVPSPDRVVPPCRNAHPGGCGGCDWQHASLPAQRAIKATVIAQQLRRLAGIDREIVVEALPGDEASPGSPSAADETALRSAPGLGWRTRVQFAVDRDGMAGLRAHRSHKVIDIGDCPLAHPAIRDLDIPGHDWTGADTVEAAVGSGAGPVNDTENVAVIVTTSERGGAGGAKGGGHGRRGRGERGRGERGRQAGAHRTQIEGRPYLTQYASGRYWQVSAGGFWQVHPAAADALSAAVLAALQPRQGDTVVDLYCGAGLFAGVIAPHVADGTAEAGTTGEPGAVIGVESDAAAVKDARRNLSDYPWVRVHRADVAQAVIEDRLPLARLVVADPPRAGLASAVIDYLTGESGVERFAYVSCDPATLARDLALLTNGGWRLVDLRAFDAFPMTHHVECVATLTR